MEKKLNLIPAKKRKPKTHEQLIVFWDDEGTLRPIAAVYRNKEFINLEEWHRDTSVYEEKAIRDVVFWAYLPKAFSIQ